jgi:hypothetical protein
MSAAASACGQNAASPGIGTRSSASPKLATSPYVLCWSSVPTMCSVRMGEIPPYSGVCTWPRAEASSPVIGPSSPSLASWQYCFIASSHLDHPGAIHPVLRSSSLRKEIMSNCLQLPRVPDECVPRWAFTRPSDNWQHRLLLLTPTDTEPRAAHSKCE